MDARVKPFLKAALVAALLAATPPAFSPLLQTAHAAESATQRAGRAAIAAQYRAADVAVVRHDAATLAAQMAPDFKSYERDGTIADRAKNVAGLRESLSGQVYGVPLKFTKSQSKILSLKWRGPDAIVQVQTTMVGVASRSNKSMRIEVVGVSRDYWGKTARGWQLRQSVTTQMKRWINGVPDPSM